MDIPMPQNPKHVGGYQAKKDPENTESGKPANHTAGLHKIEISCSAYIQIANVLNAMTINDDRASNE
jgi:hypothetical protein